MPCLLWSVCMKVLKEHNWKVNLKARRKTAKRTIEKPRWNYRFWNLSFRSKHKNAWFWILWVGGIHLIWKMIFREFGLKHTICVHIWIYPLFSMKQQNKPMNTTTDINLRVHEKELFPMDFFNIFNTL